MMLKKTLILCCLVLSATCFVHGKPAITSKVETDSRFNHELQQHYQTEIKDLVFQLKQSIDTHENPMTHRAQSAYTDYQSSPVAGAFVNAIKKSPGNSDLDATQVLLLFISSSMPLRVIQSYLAQAEPINNQLIVVIRGTVDNSLRLLPTVDYLKKIKAFTGCGQDLCQRAVNTVIDPRLFQQYNIQQVPALAYSGEFSHAGYYDNHQLPKRKEPTVVVGEATLPFLIKTLSEEINDENLTALAKRYVY
jgi:type-F conjugative transfer system pilin assembly protein TrbC